jgi:hypothetical protein
MEFFSAQPKQNDPGSLLEKRWANWENLSFPPAFNVLFLVSKGRGAKHYFSTKVKSRED